jgi:uncharacterized membrane-anchored protein YhcB (DUF1043 family)
MKEFVRYLIAGVIISIMISFIEMRFAERDAQRAYNKYLQDNQKDYKKIDADTLRMAWFDFRRVSGTND